MQCEAGKNETQFKLLNRDFFEWNLALSGTVSQLFGAPYILAWIGRVPKTSSDKLPTISRIPAEVYKYIRPQRIAVSSSRRSAYRHHWASKDRAYEYKP
jgi:hypothetical protein